MSNISNAPQIKRKGVGASCSVLLCYLHPSKLIPDRYPNKDKHDALDGIIITRRDVIRVIRREQLCILMKYEDFGDHKLHCIQKWVRVTREGNEAHSFQDSEKKEERGEVDIESDACGNPIHTTNREDINALLEDGYEVDDDILPAPKNTQSNIGKTDQPVYKYG